MLNAETHPHSNNKKQRTYFNNSQFGSRETIRRHKKKRTRKPHGSKSVGFPMVFFTFPTISQLPNGRINRNPNPGPIRIRIGIGIQERRCSNGSQKIWRDETCRERSRHEYRHFEVELNRKDLQRLRPS